MWRIRVNVCGWYPFGHSPGIPCLVRTSDVGMGLLDELGHAAGEEQMRGVGNAGIVDSLRVGEFRSLWSAEGVSILGDQLARVALAILVFERTSSALLTALTYALTFVPAVLGG